MAVEIRNRNLPVVHLSPLEGTAFAGANCRGEGVSLRRQRNGGKYKRKTIPQSFAQGSCSLRILLSPHPSFCNKLQKSTCTLAVPKIFCGIRVEYFDRGAKPCSLHRPQDALRKLCSKGRLFGTVKTVPYRCTPMFIEAQ